MGAKIRVLAIWLTAALFGRDIVSLASVQHPREAFITDGELASPPRAPSRPGRLPRRLPLSERVLILLTFAQNEL
jgi:hypothetical protein